MSESSKNQEAGWRYAVGQKIESYLLTECYCRDGVGETYRARDRRDGSSCLLSCFCLSAPMAVVEMILARCESLMGLFDTGGIVHAVLRGENALDSLIICDVPEGQSVKSLVSESGVMNEARGLLIFRGALSELSRYEELGACHGRLDPGSVCLRSDGKITFGYVLFSGSADSSDDGIVGDLRSLGRVLYFMLGGVEAGVPKPEPLWELRPNLSSDTCLLVHRLVEGVGGAKTVSDVQSALSSIDPSRRLDGGKIRELLSGGVKPRVKTATAPGKGSKFRLALMLILAALALCVAFWIGFVLAHGGSGTDEGPAPEPTPASDSVPASATVAEPEEVEDAVSPVATVPVPETRREDELDLDEDLVEDEFDIMTAPPKQEAAADGGWPELEEKLAREALDEVAEWEEEVEEEILELLALVEQENALDEQEGAENVLDEQQLLRLQEQLELALRKRNLDAASNLVAQGAKLDWASQSGASLLQQACARRHQDVVEFMLKSGCDPDWRPGGGGNFRYPLQVVLSDGRRSHGILRLLLRHGADPDVLSGDRIDDGVVQSGLVMLCNEVYRRGDGKYALEALRAWYEANKESLGEHDKMSAMLVYALRSDLPKELLREMVRRTSSMRNHEYGMFLVQALSSLNRVEILEWIKKKRVDVNSLFEHVEDGVTYRETPLAYVIRHEYDDFAVRWLLAEGANVKWEYEDGKSIFDMCRDPKRLQLLLEARRGKRPEVPSWSDEVYTTGTTSLTHNSHWDADLNAPTFALGHVIWKTNANQQGNFDLKDADFYWRVEGDTRVLEPRNGCGAVIFKGDLTPFRQISVSSIQRWTFSPEGIRCTKENNPLRKDTIVLFRTSNGNFGKLRVVSLEDSSDKKLRNCDLRVVWYVYHLDKDEVRRSNSKKTW
jgi:hypothetical protein